MTHYINYNPQAKVRSVETASVDDKVLTFVQLSKDADVAAIKQLLLSPEMSQEILSQNLDAQGGTLLVCRGDSAPETLLEKLRVMGEELKLPIPKEAGFNPWLWRGLTSIAGQSLQITSGFLGKGTASDRYSLIGFGTLNLMANFTNIVFGAQEKHDTHQLRLLKQQVNAALQPHAMPDNSLPLIDRNPLDMRQPKDRTFAQRSYDFMQQYSVSFGEIGLRTLGATQLAFPFTNYKKAVQTLSKTGSLAETISVAKNTNKVTYAAGLLTLLGKFTSMASKEPDTYNPNPSANSTLNQFRERIAFPLSSVLEGVGAVYMTHDRFARQKITLNGKTMPDYFGGVGNAIFVGGYGIRLSAPYGSLEVDMEQLYAHASDALAQVRIEELPSAIGAIALQLKQHFHDKPFTTAEIYAQIAKDLSKTHGIHILPADNAPQQDKPQDKPGHIAAQSNVYTPIYDKRVDSIDKAMNQAV